MNVVVPILVLFAVIVAGFIAYHVIEFEKERKRLEFFGRDGQRRF